jgi:hypothetical protein
MHQGKDINSQKIAFESDIGSGRWLYGQSGSKEVVLHQFAEMHKSSVTPQLVSTSLVVQYSLSIIS